MLRVRLHDSRLFHPLIAAFFLQGYSPFAGTRCRKNEKMNSLQMLGLLWRSARKPDDGRVTSHAGRSKHDNHNRGDIHRPKPTPKPEDDTTTNDARTAATGVDETGSLQKRQHDRSPGCSLSESCSSASHLKTRAVTPTVSMILPPPSPSLSVDASSRSRPLVPRG